MARNIMNCCIKRDNVEVSDPLKICSTPRIPRPPNAFMLYATDNRKVLSHKHPADSNKVISKKLGTNWKNLSSEEKNKYFEKARVVAIEHKEKYPDYVYNPKEARLRKAMREAANRDRSIGASPMLPRPSARRANAATWGASGSASAAGGPVTSTTHGTHEDPLMMSRLNQGMRGPGLDSPCFSPVMSSTSGRINGSGNEQFMSPSMGASTPSPGYSTPKMHQDSPLPPPLSPAPVVHPSYLQTNPLSQLQQQTEMWHNYQDNSRPRSSGNPYMMQDIQSPYHHQPSPSVSGPNPMLMEKHCQAPNHPIHTMNPLSLAMSPSHSNENVPPDEHLRLKENMMPDEFAQLETKHSVEPPQPLMESNVQHQNDYGSNVYGTNVGLHHEQTQPQSFLENTKIKRIPHCFCHKNISCKYSLFLPLSCTNFCASPDLYTNNLDYQRDYFTKYFHSLPEFDLFNLSAEDGHCFPYASRVDFCEQNIKIEDCPQPSFLKTDVGFIPITFENVN